VREKSVVDGKIVTKPRVEVRFRLEQRQYDPVSNESYHYIMKQIAETFNVNINTSIHNENMEYWLISITNPAKLIPLIHSLDKFTLFTSKRLNFEDWKSVHGMMIDKLHTSDIGREKIKLIKSGMNKQRNHCAFLGSARVFCKLAFFVPFFYIIYFP
jgi:hypothetical protein